ncbi:MAG: mannose-1-phosphate guanylyltransferase/mannose-6-phosphate isomerase [Xanthobacteraceae bacterium]
MAGLIIPLIMCGGAGTRLWPASREGRPKQFLQLVGPRSTFQDTVRRVSDSALFARPIVITNRQYRFLVADQLAEIEAEADILLEPIRRDSGPAIAAGAAFAQRRGGDAVMLVLAADHVVNDAAAFVEACRAAQPLAEEGRIVTFGVRPTEPTTEYGYIRLGAALGHCSHAVEKFVEKPDAPTAQRYIAEGYLWNSGNFMFRSDHFLAEYRRFEPASAAAVVEAVDKSSTDLGFVLLDSDAFARAKALSVDYAIMERTARAAVLPVSFDWSDVGSWCAVWKLAAKDAAGNAAQGQTLFLDACNCYVASDKALVAMLGVDNLVVVASEDAILVAHRDRAADLKRAVAQLKETAPSVTKDHLKVYRPWGSYQALDQGNRYQVKRIIVKPKSRLSLQKHHHRAEHWVVVRGTARVTIEDDVKMLHENESIYIPIGAMHRLENPGKIDLELIEVQSGSYLGEDDIVRFDDDYHRP